MTKIKCSKFHEISVERQEEGATRRKEQQGGRSKEDEGALRRKERRERRSEEKEEGRSRAHPSIYKHVYREGCSNEDEKDEIFG